MQFRATKSLASSRQVLNILPRQPAVLFNHFVEGIDCAQELQHGLQGDAFVPLNAGLLDLRIEFAAQEEIEFVDGKR